MNRKGPHLIILVGFKTNHIPQHFTTKLLLQYDYYNWGHLDKVDQSYYRKITIRSEKVSCQLQNWSKQHGLKSTNCNIQTLRFEPAEENHSCGLNFRIPGQFFAYHWITKVPIVLYLVLLSVPTNVNDVAVYSEVALSCVFWEVR